MLDKFIFENHLGQRFEGLPNGVYLNYNDLRDYSWSYETVNSRISRFYRPVTSRKIPLVVLGKTEDEAVATMNQLHERAEADIEANIPGKIFVGDYYTNGYITASVKGNYLINKRLCNIELTLTSDDPAWYRENTYVFLPGGGEKVTSASGKDYPFDYAYDYALSNLGQRIVCDSVSGSAFKLLIYGAAANPSITIGGHTYAVNGSISAGEMLLIDSTTKTITLTRTKTISPGKVSVTKINWFDKRGREDYIFEPIPAGQSVVSWSGAFGFDLTVIEKRSEPKWT